ncbi:MAG: hypothetical protein M3Y56_03335, partial [Armatimonadota bacterium]|nr:hypothetical protein [Armatimonadota bacterium]
MNGGHLKVLATGIMLCSCVMTPLRAGAATTTATGLLKATMAKYASLHSFQARCLWNDIVGQQHAPPSGKAAQDIRTISYQWPNRFKVITNVSNGFVMTAVSDGKHLVEFTNKDLTARQQYPAPASIDRATTMQMQHPMFCGSLLYQFFGGPSKLSSLANLDRQPIRFGSDKVVEGVKCRTVLFYGQQTYGHTTVAISLPDHLVREIL